MLNYRSYIICVLFVFVINSAPLSAEEKKANAWKIRGRSESIVEWKETSDKDSAIDEGTSFRQELSVGLLKNENRTSMGLNIRGRSTNDEQIDDDDARLLYLNAFYSKNNFKAEAGDVAASFNPLVLSASVKGSKLNYRHGNYTKGFEVNFLGGIQKSAWDQVYEGDKDTPFDRYLAGFETEFRYGTGQKFAFSASAVNDMKNSNYEADDDNEIDETRSKAVTAGFSWDWRFNRYFSTRGDVAFTRTDADKDDDKDYENAEAFKVKFLTKPHKKYVRSNFTFERIDPKFRPFIATAARDTEKIQNDTTIMFSRKFKVRITLKENKNNIEDDEENTRTTDDGVIFFTIRPDWLKRGEFGLRTQFKKTEIEGTSEQNQKLAIGEVNFSIRPKSGWEYGFGWIYTHIDEDESLGNFEDQDIHTIRTKVGWKKSFNSDHLFRSALRLDCNLMDRDSDEQTTYGGRADLGYDAGKWWSADLTATSRKSYRDAADDNNYNSYELRGNYHPGGDRSKAVRLSASKRITDTESETRTTDHIVKLSYLFSF